MKATAGVFALTFLVTVLPADSSQAQSTPSRCADCHFGLLPGGTCRSGITPPTGAPAWAAKNATAAIRVRKQADMLMDQLANAQPAAGK